MKDGAKVVESADDIFEDLGLAGDGRSAVSADRRPPPPDPVLECLTAGEACALEEIAERSGLSTARLLPRLFDLELRGAVTRAGGGRFVRVDRPC